MEDLLDHFNQPGFTLVNDNFEFPDLLGAAVPGMPAGSPGMEMGEQHDAYQVIGLDRQGQEQVVSSYPGN